MDLLPEWVLFSPTFFQALHLWERSVVSGGKSVIYRIGSACRILPGNDVELQKHLKASRNRPFCLAGELVGELGKQLWHWELFGSVVAA